jgi:DNA-binding NarL/FixJ family response regulator
MGAGITLIIGPGGCGKTHRLDGLADAHRGPVVRIQGAALERSTELGPLRALLEGEPLTHHEVAEQLLATLDQTTLLIVDDVHHLDELSVAAVSALAGRLPHLAVAHRPSARTDLASFDDTLIAHGTIERVAPLNETELGALLAEFTGRAVDGGHVSEVLEATGGVPGWAIAVAGSDRAALNGPVERELARAGPVALAVAQVATLAPRLPDDVLAVAAGVDTADVRLAFDDLASGGLLDPESGELWPAIRAASRALLTSARRRALHERLATAVIERGGEISDAAEHLLQSGATGASAADLYSRAGDEARFRDPAVALEWYGEATIAGGLPVAGMVGEIEAAAFAGQPMLSQPTPGDLTPEDRVRLIAVRAADEARDGRPGRAAELFDTLATGATTTATAGARPSLTVDTARLLAATMHAAAQPPNAGVGMSDVEPPSDPLDSAADMAHRLTLACRLHADDPASSATRFSDAADALERLEPTFVLPDSPHAIGALHLAAVGDHPGAELLLGRAERAAPGGPMLAARHHLLRAWVQLRAGRYELPVDVIRDPPHHVDPRDRLVFASIVAGIARRNGDIGRLREAWITAEPLLLAGTADLFHLEVIGELVLAAARMRQLERAQPVLERLAGLAGGENAGAWAVPHAWLLVQLGVETDDAEAVAAAAAVMRSVASDRPHDHALLAATDTWSTILSGRTDAGFVDQVEQAANMLAERTLPWEASRLAGQAAVRVTDASVARRLLEQARLHHRAAEGTESAAVSDAGLSERELEIARYVVDGLTHREVGAQLYISPKTVEHHVSKIRRKVQAGSRAEMLAILRDLVPSTEGKQAG